MSKKRLQVILDESEYEKIRTLASREEMTVSAWVRRALRRERDQSGELSRLGLVEGDPLPRDEHEQQRIGASEIDDIDSGSNTR